MTFVPAVQVPINVEVTDEDIVLSAAECKRMETDSPFESIVPEHCVMHRVLERYFKPTVKFSVGRRDIMYADRSAITHTPELASFIDKYDNWRIRETDKPEPTRLTVMVYADMICDPNV